MTMKFLQFLFFFTVVWQSSADPFNRWHKSKLVAFLRNWWFERHHCLLEEPCQFTLPQHASENCRKERKEDIFKARLWYQLTNENKPKRTEFPFPEIPFLDQPSKTTLFFYSMDPFEGRYIAGSSAAFQVYGKDGIQRLITRHANSSFDNPQDYIALYEDAQKLTKSFMVPHVLDNPSQYPTFTDIVTNDKWMEDDYFVQQLLTRECPFLFKKVTVSGSVGIKLSELKSVMSSSFSFDNALSKVLGEDITFDKAVGDGIVYVLYNEQMNDMKNAEDVFKGKTGSSTLDEITSAIGFFVSKNGYLKVFAIQANATQDSNVLTPSSSYDWLKAKGSFFVSYSTYCQGYYHAGHYHIVSTVFCASFRRHFAVKHPLYILFKHHCEGTIPHAGAAFAALVLPNGTTEQTFGISYTGVGKLVKKAFSDRHFGRLDLPNVMEENGLGDTETLKYFPFRDDSQLLWNELTRFLNEFVEEVYHDSRDIWEDSELQSFTNEVSFEGKTQPDGSTGKYVGFPPKITSKDELVRALRSILWYNVLHTVANYGLTPPFLPFRTTKIYTNQGAKDKFLNLGSVSQIVAATQFGNTVMNLRINRIMAYYDKIEDERLRHIVWKSYSRFHGCIQKSLAKRNDVRKSKGMMGMQILEPKWLTNSIHT